MRIHADPDPQPWTIYYGPDVSGVLVLAGEDLPTLPAVEHPAPPL